MRGQTVFSLALVALATTSYAAPLQERTDSPLEAREAVVDVGRDFSGRDVVDAIDDLADLLKRQIARAAG